MNKLSVKVRRVVSISLVATALAFFGLGVVQAGATSVPMNVTSLRPYASSPVAYLAVASSELCGTSVFTIPRMEEGGKEMYATALAALLSGKRISLEVSNSTGCTGWGTRLQSLTIYP